MSKRFTIEEVLDRLPPEVANAFTRGTGDADLTDSSVHVAFAEAVLSLAGVPYSLATCEEDGRLTFQFETRDGKKRPREHSVSRRTAKGNT